MKALLILGGTGLVLVMMVDVIWSTLTTRGSGIVTRPLTTRLQVVVGAIYRRVNRFAVLSAAGPLAIVLLATVWIGGAWLGWTLIFSAFPETIVDGKTGVPADAVGRIYFVGFTLSTLGVGDLEPDTHLARILTNLAAFNGLMLVTLIITYAIPVVSGAVARRKLAFTVSTQGNSPADLVSKSWSGENFRTLERMLISLSSDLLQSAEQHLAYPIVGHFHSREPGGSIGLQMAILDEALSLLTFGIDGPRQPDPVALANARNAVGHYLKRASRGMLKSTSEVPPLPELATLRSLEGSGLRLKQANEFAQAMAAQADRRRMLLLLVRNDGLDWSMVHSPRGADA